MSYVFNRRCIWYRSLSDDKLAIGDFVNVRFSLNCHLLSLKLELFKNYFLLKTKLPLCHISQVIWNKINSQFMHYGSKLIIQSFQYAITHKQQASYNQSIISFTMNFTIFVQSLICLHILPPFQSTSVVGSLLLLIMSYFAHICL